MAHLLPLVILQIYGAIYKVLTSLNVEKRQVNLEQWTEVLQGRCQPKFYVSAFMHSQTEAVTAG